mmetsp:Transcript_34149/g.102166  ORF Transcript_34149/g.102166 Transcript_34149/m.102166 type:complete len:81 (-) Transcript_34149:1960-2202(-)
MVGQRQGGDEGPRVQTTSAAKKNRMLRGWHSVVLWDGCRCLLPKILESSFRWCQNAQHRPPPDVEMNEDTDFLTLQVSGD